MGELAISVRGVGKRYLVWTHGRPTSLSDRLRFATARVRRARDGDPGSTRREEIWALRDIDVDVVRGEVLGVIGRNGAGKSTLLSLLSRVTSPTCGRIVIEGRVGSLLEVGTGFHPELSGRDNVFLNGAILGMRRSEVAAKFDQIVDFSGVRDFIDIPVKRYSSGMHVRLAFAVAAHFDPEIVILDEVLAVGDRGFQEKCLRRIEELVAADRTVVFVSHDVNAVARLCSRAILLEQGRVVFDGPVDEAVGRYLREQEHSEGVATPSRAGTGDVRVARVEVRPLDGGAALHADRPIAIELALERHGAPTTPGGLDVRIDVASMVGADLATLSTRFDLAQRIEAPVGQRALVVCTLPQLPLRPGSYFLTVTLQRRTEIVDRLEDAIEFTISPSDFFGSGVLPGPDHAPLLLPQRWRVEEATSTRRAAGF